MKIVKDERKEVNLTEDLTYRLEWKNIIYIVDSRQDFNDDDYEDILFFHNYQLLGVNLYS